MGADPLCATCERPSHAGPCYPDVTGPLHARIADLERQLEAAITHPLAVAAVKAYVASMRAPNSAPNAIANWKAQDDWERAEFPIHADNPHPETAP